MSGGFLSETMDAPHGARILIFSSFFLCHIVNYIIQYLFFS